MVESLWEWLLEIVYMGLTKMGRLILILDITIFWVGFLYWVKGGKKVTKIIHFSLCFVNVCAVWPAVSVSCCQDFPCQNGLNPGTVRKKYFLKFHLLNILSQQPTKYTFQNCQKILNSFTMKNNKWYLIGK